MRAGAACALVGAMRNTVLAVVLSGCCFTPASPPTSTSPVTTVAPTPSDPAAPACPDLATNIIGIWSSASLVEEYRPDGVYVINGTAGTYRFTSPGHVVLDEPTTGLHGEWDVGVADASTLVGIDARGAALVYTRTSPAPAIPASCLDLSSSFARTWNPRPGGPPEVYGADGTYRVVGAGRWTFTAPGRLLLTRDDGMTTDYVVAMPSATTMLAVRAGQGVAYDAAP